MRADGTERVVVVIAAYKEAAAIGTVVAGLRARGWHVLVVDDGSNDNTAAVARDAGAVVLRHAANLGQGAALRTGFAAVLRAGEAGIVVTFDADGQHDPDDVATLVAPIRAGRCDVVLGTRFRDAATTAAVPLLRRVALRTIARLMRITSGIAVSDAHNGLRALSVDALARMHLVQDRMAHASEITREVARLGLRYEEATVHIRYTRYSLSKGQRLWDGISILWDLLIARQR